MSVKLVRIGIEDADILWKMQVEAFQEMYEKYQDIETSPATEKVDKMVARLKQSFTYYYYIVMDEEIVGAIRVVDEKISNKPKRISPIFIMPKYRNKGLGQKAILLAEEIHGSTDWSLDTIMQEPGNCHLYEKMGYKLTGEQEVINDRMTLVLYRK